MSQARGVHLLVLLGALLTVATGSASDAVPSLSQEPISPLPEVVRADPRKIVLGERLFHDPRLSSNTRTSCATCHPLANGGMDGKAHVITIKNTPVTLNTPSVYNATLSSSTGWLGIANSVNDHVNAVVSDPAVFNSGWTSLIQRISQDSAYIAGFKALYDDAPTPVHINDLLNTFLTTLTTPRARFDRYLRGDTEAITADERSGYMEFKAHGCIACHQGVNIGGNLYQRFGVFENYLGNDGVMQAADQGRFLVTARERDRQVFRVPSLRNVALTAPYFHDGSAATLEDAVKVMMHFQLGQIPADAEVQLIAGFLRTLTGELPGRTP